MGKLKKRFSRSPELHVEPRHITKHIRVGDLRDLITWCFCQATPPSAPKWIGVENKNGVEHIVSVMVPGLPVDSLVADLDNPQPQPLDTTLVPALSQFDMGWPTKADAHKDRIDQPEASLAQVQFTKSEKKQLSKQRKKLEESEGKELVPLDQLVISTATKKRLGFVLEPPNSDWVSTCTGTADGSKNSVPSVLTHAWAVDCEMCTTASGKVLTRVSVVDETLECIYTTFVKPEEPVIDYLTQFSGITPELLEGVTTTLKDVQNWFKENVKPDTVLVGHSIDCDLEVLKLVHASCIDTGLLYPHPKGLPFRHALKWLVRKHLNADIQSNGEKGHDPTEDAAACIQLLNLKRRKGLEYGSFTQAKCITKVLQQENKTTSIIDYAVPFWDWTQSAQSVTSVTSDDEVVTRLRQQINKHSWTFAALRDLEKCSLEVYGEVLAATNRRIAEIIDSMPPRSILIIWTGYGDRTVWKELLSQRTTWRRECRAKKIEEIEPKWTAQDDELLFAAAQVGRMGLSMIKMIPGELPRKVAKRFKNTPGGEQESDEEASGGATDTIVTPSPDPGSFPPAFTSTDHTFPQ